MFTRAVQTMVLAMLVAGCMDDGAPTGVSSSPAAIAIVSGDAQAGTVDQALVNLLVVRVSDLRGRPVRNTLVQFEVVAGAGTIVARSDGLTDSVGMARAQWRLGTSTAAEQTARARLFQQATNAPAVEVTFRATALPDAPRYFDLEGSSVDPIEPAPSFTRTVVARALDAYHNPVPGAVVHWSAPMAGTLLAEQTVTGADGSSENQWTVRSTSGGTLGAGGYWITAAITEPWASVPAVLFTQIVGDARIAAVSLAAGGAHSCAVTEIGEVYCWGDNSSGQLGQGNGGSSPPFVARLESTESFTQVVAGTIHTCALATSGKAQCWGFNGDGQLGDGTRGRADRPVSVVGSETFVSLTAGALHTCGLTDSGTAYCWGANTDGQLGDGTTAQRSVPTAVAGGAKFASITAGAVHTCGLTRDGATLCWGNNGTGQVSYTAGNAQCRTRCTTPTPVAGRFVGLSAGRDYTCGLDADGTVACWGGYLNDRMQVGTIRFTKLVGSRADSFCGITLEGRAYCWTFSYEYDDYYDNTPSVSEQQPVAGDRVFSALELGDGQTCGLERGTAQWVVCWSGGRTTPGFVMRAGRP